MLEISNNAAAAVVARFLKARGVQRVFGLCGGHIMPIWMRLDAEGIAIVDVRDERAAVHMAHAHAEITGELGVALVTAGPGVTNAMTGIANAYVARAPVLVLSGLPPPPRRTAGLCRTCPRRFRSSAHALRAHRARTRARPAGARRGGLARLRPRRRARPGDTSDSPSNTLRGNVPKSAAAARAYPAPKPSRAHAAGSERWPARSTCFGRRASRSSFPAAGVRARRRARAHSPARRLGAVYLDTGESRGLVPDQPSLRSSARCAAR